MSQPWNHVIFPSAGSNWDVYGGMTAARLKAIPAVGRALALIGGMSAQMPLEDMRGDTILPRPRLLDAPDPDRPRSWFVGLQVEDYLVHGNAVCLVTARDAEGWPAAVVWVPAQWVLVTQQPDGRVDYWVNGQHLNTADVVHVRRGADPFNPVRGIGVLEQYMLPLRLINEQDTYQRTILREAAVPSVAVIAPNPDLDQDEADKAAERWVEKYSGPVRRPAILPAGTVVTPLSWSPNDAQMVQAREASLKDAANMLNIDGYWVGAGAGSYTYKSPGPMYLNLLRQTVSPILADFEGAWSQAWLPRGRRVTFFRREVLADDMSTAVAWVSKAITAKIITQSEGRVLLGFSADVPDELKPKPVPAALAGAAPATTEATDDDVPDDEKEAAA
ncbi:MAG: phage portal protein [Micropruina sp.]|uniref:phage portal protein n=1 Tax=Micropruina sp. TaxID=2737536 RepID=UPI0039E22CBC